MYEIDVYADTSSLFKTLLPCSEFRSFHSGSSDPRNRVLRIRSQDDVTSLNDFDFDTPSQDSGLANLNRMIYDVHPDALGLVTSAIIGDCGKYELHMKSMSLPHELEASPTSRS